MAEPIDESQINPIFLQQLQDALESDNEDQHDQVEDLNLGVDDQLLVDSLRSIISGENSEPLQHENWNQVLDGNPDPATLEAVQNALKELGGHEPPGGGWKRSLTEEDRDRIRHDNRARKRKWRDSNVMRNKDNDLRSRIVRKANSLFGENNSPQKFAWVEDEFQKRRERRFMRDSYGDSFRRQPYENEHARYQELFRSSNSMFGSSQYTPLASMASHLIHAALNSPRPPAYLLKYTKKPSIKLPMKIRNHDAKALGAPPSVVKLAKKYTPEPKVKQLGELGEKLGLTPLPQSVIAKFGLPNVPQDFSKLGPMPPLPKSILEHQKREKERKEKEARGETETPEAAARGAQDTPQKDATAQEAHPAPASVESTLPGQVQTTQPSSSGPQSQQPPASTAGQAAPVPVIPTPPVHQDMPVLGPVSSEPVLHTPVMAAQPESQSLSHTPSHAPPHEHQSHAPSHAESPYTEEDLGNIDDVLGNALSALQEEQGDILDPSRAIQELQMALEQQGIFENQ